MDAPTVELTDDEVAVVREALELLILRGTEIIFDKGADTPVRLAYIRTVARAEDALDALWMAGK